MATAFATTLDTLRMSAIGGSRKPRASCAGVTRPLSARLRRGTSRRDLRGLRHERAEADARKM
jgi:hypothetical protein